MNMFCLFVEILDTSYYLGYARQKKKDFELFSQQRGRENLFIQCCQITLELYLVEKNL